MTQKELGYVELEWTCKHCNTINPGMNRVCSNCGAPMAQEDEYELPDQQVLITDQKKLEEAKKGPAIECPYCHVLNPDGTVNCVQCGGDIQAGLKRQAGEVLGAHQTAAVPDRPCPSCGQLVSANAQRCPNCGGSLVEAAQPSAIPAQPKKTPLWLVAVGVVLVLACIGSVIAFAVLSNRTSDIAATVADRNWQLSIDILAQRPVQRSDWHENVPSSAKDTTCQDKYKETSNFPVPKATEECGTPYVVDQGSGAGKVVQDCVYRVYDSYCNYTVLDWVVVDTAQAQGRANDPAWPAFNLQAGQQEGERHETYQVIFDADGQSYTYTPVDVSEFSQFYLGSEWLLSINTFGAIKDIRSR
jgi:RNA polymerase subunit RPABC4/transcription elongation factor Spt4